MAKILFVEDEEFNVQSFMWELQDAGHQVVRVGEGEETIRCLENGNHNFDLIILDIMLPRGNHRAQPAIGNDIKTGKMGLEILRQLREEMNDETPVIALTAAMDDDLKTKVMNYDVEKYFVKPIALEEFMGAVEKALEHSLPAEVGNNEE